MKKLMALLMIFLWLVPVTARCEADGTLVVTDYLADQSEVDALLMAECKAGYTPENPLIVVNPYGNAPLSAVAVFSTDEAVGGSVTVHGKAQEDDIVGRFDASKEHFVPIYGLYAGAVNRVTLALDDGRATDLEIETEPIDLGLKDYAVEGSGEGAAFQNQLVVCANMILHCYAGYDSKGDLRWALTGTGANAITRMDNGRFLIPNELGHGAEFPNGLTGIREIDPLGKVYNTYVFNGGEHHEIIVLPNGDYMVTGSRPGYETNRDYVFEIEPVNGDVVWSLDMAEVIAPGSSGCESDKGEDWCHNNALAYDEATDTLLVSCRHLCAVVAVEKSTGTLKWILGDPAGWDERYAPYLLSAQEDFEWAYGQHQLTLLEDGGLLMFDNGEFGRAKMVNADQALADGDNYSRAVIYRVDEAAKSVEQLWEYGKALGPDHYAGSMSGIQRLGEGQYLVTFGTCTDAEGETRTWVQYLREDQPVWELSYRGSSTYRSYLYPIYGGQYDPSVSGKWHGDMGQTVRLSDISLPDSDEGQAPDGVKVELYPFEALRFSGSFEVENEEALTDYAVALVGDAGEPLFFDLGYTKSKGQEGVRVNLSRWVSLKGLPAGDYAIKLVIGPKLLNTNRTVTIRG